MYCPQQRIERGFTLVEMLVAIAMTAIIAVVLFSLLGGSISNWKKAEAHMNQSFHRGNLYILLSTKLESILQYDSKVEPGKYFSAESDRVLFLSYQSVLFPYFPVLTEIYLENGKLMMKETPFFWDRPNTELPEAKEMELSDHVKKLEMGYLLREKVKRNDVGKWEDHFDPDTERGKVLRDIRFEITWDDGDSMIVSHPLPQKEEKKNVRPHF
ncbi:MAG: type II secretion system protein [Acidobacteria bacterium]|nr:type II secretion system protein [Acidobacteriota bacterium]